MEPIDDPNAAFKAQTLQKRSSTKSPPAKETNLPTKKKPGADDPAPAEDTATADRHGLPEAAEPPARIKNKTKVKVQVHCCS